jgi:hypothetical protein
MKTQVIKSLLNITVIILFSIALMELYRENMELKCNYEALAWQMENKIDQLYAFNAALYRRTHQNAQKTSN